MHFEYKFKKLFLATTLIMGAVVTHSTEAEGTKLTAVDQSKGSNADVERTRQIRERIVDDKSLSTQAHNITIVTMGQYVTLRGSVQSSRERQVVRDHIRAVVNNAAINEKYLSIIQPSPAAR
jgi:osmotically-inducible protein OsmY